MRLIILFAVFLLLSADLLAQSADKQPAEYAIVLHLNPKYHDEAVWTDADNQAVGAHFVALQQLQKEGKLVYAGRTLNKESIGIAVFKNMTEVEVRKVMENDAAIKRGIMKAELQPFHTALH